MATKTSKTKTAAASKKAASTKARANTPAPKAKAKPKAGVRVSAPKALATKDFDVKTALIGGGIGALVGGLATKLIFLR